MIVNAVIPALVFQLFVVASHAQMLAALRTLEPGPFSRILVICTGSSLKRIMLDRDGQPVDLPDPTSIGETCQLCSSLTAAQLVGMAGQCGNAYLQTAAAVPDLLIKEEPVKDRRPAVRCGLDPPMAA